MHRILVAEPCDIIRIRLKTFLARHSQVSGVYEAATGLEVQQHLAIFQPDLLIISQSLVADIKLLPPGRFLLIASERDDRLLQEVAQHGGRGYLLRTAPLELFGIRLCLEPEQFLYDSKLIFDDLSERFFKKETPVPSKDVPGFERLTEREVFGPSNARSSYQ